MRDLVFTTTIPWPDNAPHPTYHIHHPATPAELALHTIPDNHAIDTIMMTGGHGNFIGGTPYRLNELSEPLVRQHLVPALIAKQVQAETIMIDACDSASFIPLLSPLLDDDKGIMYCNLSDGRAHYCLNLLRRYEQIKDGTIGAALFESVFNAIDVQRGIGDIADNIPQSYPAVYVKSENKLYYYGDARQDIIQYLQDRNIEVVRLEDEDEYLDKLLYSTTSIERTAAPTLPDALQQQYNQIAISSKAGTPYQTTKLEDAEIIEKLLELFAEQYPDKAECEVAHYTAKFFPLTRRLTKQGHDAIEILARAVCQFKYNNQDQKRVDNICDNIVKVKTREFILDRLTNIFYDLIQDGKPLESKDVKEALLKDAILVYGKNNKRLAQQIVDEFIRNNSYLAKLNFDLNKGLEANSSWAKAKVYLVSAFVASVAALAIWQLGVMFALSSVITGIACLVTAGASLFVGSRINHYKRKGLSDYQQQAIHGQLSNFHADKLNAFLDGAAHSYTSQFSSLFKTNDWRYMQDYYAGTQAAEANQQVLIEEVKTAVKPHH